MATARRYTLVTTLLLLGGCSFHDDLDAANATGPEKGKNNGGVGWGDAGEGCGFCAPEGGATFVSQIQPTFSTTTTAATPPPSISGGTLLVTSNGALAIAADPDRDRVYGINLSTQTLSYTVTLMPGDEPGRVAEDGAGRIHVALRGSGVLLTFDEATGGSVVRRSVCPTPRGVAWDSSTDLVWVACATGELIGLPASGGSATQSFVIERDLRDVVVQNGALSVSKFRTSEVLRLDSSGNILRRDVPPSSSDRIPHVAWRLQAAGGGNTVVIHQAESTQAIPTNVAGGYGAGCGGEGPPPLPPDNMPTSGDGGTGAACGTNSLGNFKTDVCEELPGTVVAGLTVLGPDGSIVTDRFFAGALPVDVAVASDGSFAAVAAGDAFTTNVDNVFWFTACGDLVSGARLAPSVDPRVAQPLHLTSAQPTALAFDAVGDLVVQTREPAQVSIFDGQTHLVKAAITLSSISRRDTGHDVFHTQAGVMVACASCHPEGGDDGHVWMLDGNARRTPSLRGTIAGTAPYHWPGDEVSFDALVEDVYTTRMSGRQLATDQKAAISSWVQNIQAPPSPSWLDPASVQRGQALFTATNVGCSGCHSGAKLTNNQTMDVGTGGAFQVPPLVGVGWRTPLLHDGCAATLVDRLVGKCATPNHGNTQNLTSANVTDLVSYLESL